MTGLWFLLAWIGYDDALRVYILTGETWRPLAFLAGAIVATAYGTMNFRAILAGEVGRE